MAEPAEPAQPQLGGTRWTLVELEGKAIAQDHDERAPYLELEDFRLVGSGGCNRLVGSFELDGDGVRFGLVATTRMACLEETMDREQRLLAALEAARSYELGDATLVLLDGPRVLARFATDRPGAP